MFKSNIDLNDYEQLISCCVFPNSFIRNGTLKPQEKVLFEILCSYDFLNAEGERKGWCDVGLDRVAEEMGLSKRQVQVYLKRLVEKGFVTIIYRNNTLETDRRSSIYVLNILPGLSEADRKRIASTRTIGIKNKISGLNIIKVQTSKGMVYTSPEEFDLEYLVTGKRSSCVIEGEIGEVEIDKENTVEEFDGLKITTGRKVVDPESLKRNNSKDPGYYSDDPVVRILSGNYKDLKPMDICKYFGFVYRQVYPNDPPYLVSKKIEIPHIKRRLSQVDTDVLIEMIKFFIENYDRLFKSENYLRPRIWAIGTDWIWQKLSEHYARATEILEEEKQRESIQVQMKNAITWDDL